MGILQWLGFKGSSATVNAPLSPFVEGSHLDAVTWAHLLGLENDQRPVTRADAMALPAVAKARHLLCGQAGRLTWTAVRDADAAPVSPQPLLLRQPEDGRPRSLTMSWTVDALIFFGRAWWQIMDRRTEDRRPSRVRWVPEYAISVDPQTGVVLVENQAVNPSDLLRIDAPHEGLLTFGAGPLRAARAMFRAAGRAADNPVPVVELHQTGGEPLKQTEIEQLTSQWIKARRNPNGAVGYTSATIETRVHGAPAEQLLIQGRKAAALEAAQLLGLPAWAVDAETEGSSLTYSNVPSRTRELVDYAMAPYLDAIAGRLSMPDVVPRGTWVRAETQTLMEPDFATRMAGYKAAQDAGIYSAEECKQIELTGQITTTPDTATDVEDQP